MAKRRGRRSPGEGSFYKREDGSWIGAITVPTNELDANGKPKQKRLTVSSRDRNTARRKFAELKLQVAEGVISADRNMTMARWLDYWLNHVRGPHVRANTRQYYEEAIRLYLKPAIGRKRLAELTAVHVRTMLDSIESTAAKKRAYVVLRLSLKSAVTERLIRYNVTDAVATPEHIPVSRGAFDANTAAQIIKYAFDNRPYPEAVRRAMAFLTGARQGELLGLRWSYVELAHNPDTDTMYGTIDLAWQLQQLEQVHGCPRDDDNQPTCGRRYRCPQRSYAPPPGGIVLTDSLGLTAPKSQAGVRVVPLIGPLAAAMAELRRTAPVNDFDLVWTTEGGKPIRPKDDYKAWKALLKAAGAPDMPLHAARHTTATLLQRAGVPEDTRMKITGHSSAAAHRGYVHVSHDQTRAALDNLRALMP